jgi:hypothetical protein
MHESAPTISLYKLHMARYQVLYYIYIYITNGRSFPRYTSVVIVDSSSTEPVVEIKQEMYPVVFEFSKILLVFE